MNRCPYERGRGRSVVLAGADVAAVLATIAVVAEQDFAKEAKQRQRLSKGRGKKGSPIMVDVNRNGEAREQAANVVGVSHNYVSDAKAIKVDAVG